MGHYAPHSKAVNNTDACINSEMCTETVAVEENSLDETMGLVTLLRALESIRSGHHNAHNETSFFPIAPNAFKRLQEELALSPIDSFDAHLEYYPDKRLAFLKMSETPLHSIFVSEIEGLFENAAKPHVPALKPLRTMVETCGENGHRGQLKADGGWSSLGGSDAQPRLVLEVGYSESRNHLASKCEEFINGSDGHVQTCVAIKVPYFDKRYEEVLLHLPQCVVGL